MLPALTVWFLVAADENRSNTDGSQVWNEKKQRETANVKIKIIHPATAPKLSINQYNFTFIIQFFLFESHTTTCISCSNSSEAILPTLDTILYIWHDLHDKISYCSHGARCYSKCWTYPSCCPLWLLTRAQYICSGGNQSFSNERVTGELLCFGAIDPNTGERSRWRERRKSKEISDDSEAGCAESPTRFTTASHLQTFQHEISWKISHYTNVVLQVDRRSVNRKYVLLYACVTDARWLYRE